MTVTPGEDGKSDRKPEPKADAEAVTSQLDDALAREPQLAQPPLNLAQATWALTIAATVSAQLGRDARQDLAGLGDAFSADPTVRLPRDLAQWQQDLAKHLAARSPASNTSWDLSANVRRFQERTAERARQTTDSIRSLGGRMGTWITTIAKAAGEKVAEFYRRAAPPNWTTDPDTAVKDYWRAVQLALDEGIPLAWVPDQDTVRRLLAVPGTGAVRRAQLHTILQDRMENILDCCGERLDQIAASATTPADQLRAVVCAQEAVRALRLGLTAPAQSAAANVVDQLLYRAFTAVHGNYRHKSVPDRVLQFSQRSGIGLTFLGMLREVATIMPVSQAMTPWWPNGGTPPPTTFSRHVTAHQLTAPGQVTPVNALIAVMLAVSMLSQEHDSGWRNWRSLLVVDAQLAALRDHRAVS